MKILLLAALALSTLTGCREEQVEAVPTDNPTFEVVKLFTVDGCTIYRFDDGRRVHFADCRGSVSNQERYVCGRTGRHNEQPVYCYRDHLVETVK